MELLRPRNPLYEAAMDAYGLASLVDAIHVASSYNNDPQEYLPGLRLVSKLMCNHAEALDDMSDSATKKEVHAV